MANYEATRYDFDGANLTGIEGVNTGIVVPWGSASIPSGFLLCDGQSVSTTTYAALFAVIGYTYGGSGANFNVPDLRDRTVVGVSAANSKTLAQGIGANTVTPTGNIAGSTGSTTLTTNQIASHGHSVQGRAPGGMTGNFQLNAFMAGSVMCCANSTSTINANNTGGGQSHDHTLSANFTGSANSVLQPGLVLNYIIKT
jgi:microcystin-dependent protein